MRILFNMASRKNLVCVNLYDHLTEEMSKIADVKVWGPPRKDFINEPLEKTIKRLYGNDPPDWVVSTPYMHAEEGRWIGWKAPPKNLRSWRIAAITSDIHASGVLRTSSEGQVEALNQAGFDTILMLYTETPWSRRPKHELPPRYHLNNLVAPIFHLAPWANPNQFAKLNKTRKYDATCLGASARSPHPLRHTIKGALPTLAKGYGWETLIGERPPGKSTIRDIDRLLKEGHIVGQKYLQALALSKTFIFGTSIFKYPLLKIVEGWLAGACVVCDQPLTWERMHMKDGVNYVRIDAENWRVKLKATLDDEATRIHIAERGYETAMKYHTTETRAKELLAFLEGFEHRGWL